MKDKTETQNNRNERGGITQGRQSWAGKVIITLQPIGTEKAGLWFTHKAIMKRLQDQGRGKPDNLAQVLYYLVKSGHLERAAKPDKIKDQFTARPEYIYRRTAKPYQEKPAMKATGRGFQLRLEHARLPKWFRDMMQ